MSALVIQALPGAGLWVRLSSAVRGLVSRLAPRISGVERIVIQGRALPLKAQPLGVARELIPAIIRCSEGLVAARIDDAFYADLVLVLAIGLALPPKTVEGFSISLWDCMRVLDAIARVNGLQAAEGSGEDLGKLLAVLSGTNSTPRSSPPLAGAGSTSTNA